MRTKNTKSKVKGDTFLKKVQPYLGRIYKDVYRIVSAKFQYAGKTDDQNRTYFVMKHMITGEEKEVLATRAIQFLKLNESKVINDNVFDKDMKEIDERGVITIDMREYDKKIENLTKKLNRVETMMSELTNKMNSSVYVKKEPMISRLFKNFIK